MKGLPVSILDDSMNTIHYEGAGDLDQLLRDLASSEAEFFCRPGILEIQRGMRVESRASYLWLRIYNLSSRQIADAFSELEILAYEGVWRGLAITTAILPLTRSVSESEYENLRRLASAQFVGRGLNEVGIAKDDMWEVYEINRESIDRTLVHYRDGRHALDPHEWLSGDDK